jgi:predicted lactoylglutathione lyase
MSKNIFINLPVSDLKKSTSFYQSLGWTVNPQYTDETAACIVVSAEIYVMLLTHPKFKEFTPRAIPDSFQYTEVMNALTVDSKTEVNTLVETVLTMGGKEVREPQDYGFMFGRAFCDPDGHIWELIWMDPLAAK